MSREDQYNVTVTVSLGTDIRDLGTFDKMTGGEIDSEETKFWPGALGQQISLGGRKTVSNVTVSRLYDLARDHPQVPFLLSGIGKAAVNITKQPLDVDGLSVGAPLIYKGTLKQLHLPEPDSESQGAGMMELEVSAQGATQ